MKATLRIAGLSLRSATKIALRIAMLASILLCLAGCSRISQALYLRSYDRDITSATKDIANASDTPRRAEAYAKRGSAYSEKARYSKAFKLISADEYERLFDLAIKDHDQAITLDPSAEAYYTRGVTYYDRANLEAVVDGRLMGSEADRKTWFAPATADFKAATEKDPRLSPAWDRLGMIDETTGELDQAISDYTQEMALNPLGKSRLANAYCTRGGSLSSQKVKRYDAAIADYEKSLDLGASADDWSCDPYNPLIWLYTNNRSYDRAWGIVHKAQSSKKWIAPEMLDKVKKESGRSR